ncbi:MAG: hypothetical protein ACUVTG_11765 [Candidatus Oleimicrobiaceae bacterium]
MKAPRIKLRVQLAVTNTGDWGPGAPRAFKPDSTRRLLVRLHAGEKVIDAVCPGNAARC